MRNLTQEHKDKISKALKGRMPKNIDSIKGFWKGKKMPNSLRKKLSEAHRGVKLSLSHRKSLSRATKGHTVSEETRKKIGDSHRGKPLLKISGERHYFWKGGISLGSKRKAYMSFYGQRRRLKKKGNGGCHSIVEWETLKAQYNWTCPCCHKQEPEIKLTEDHIVPSSKGGSDNIENIQPLCRSCNSKKHAKEIKYQK